MSESSNLKVSVWNAFEPGTALIMATTEVRGTDEAQPTVCELTTESSGLQKEVFGWRMLEDPFGGIVDGEERERLKTALFGAMGIGVDPKKRSIAALRSFVEDANRVLAAGRVPAHRLQDVWVGNAVLGFQPFGPDASMHKKWRAPLNQVDTQTQTLGLRQQSIAFDGAGDVMGRSAQVGLLEVDAVATRKLPSYPPGPLDVVAEPRG